MTVLEALQVLAFRWSMGLYVLAIWAMLRIAGSSSDLNGLLTAAGFVSALGFAILFVLAVRFPFWVVAASAVGASVAGFLLVLLAALTSSSSHDNMGAAVAVWFAAISLPIVMLLPAGLAWLVARHPPSSVTFRILFVGLALVWLAPSIPRVGFSILRVGSVLGSGPFWSVTWRHPIVAARVLAAAGGQSRWSGDDAVRLAVALLPLRTQMSFAQGDDERSALFARAEIGAAVADRPAEAIPLVLAEIEKAGGAKAPGSADWLFQAASEGQAIDG